MSLEGTMTFLSKTYYSKAISEKFDKFDYVIKYLLHKKSIYYIQN